MQAIASEPVLEYPIIGAAIGAVTDGDHLVCQQVIVGAAVVVTINATPIELWGNSFDCMVHCGDWSYLKRPLVVVDDYHNRSL